VINSLGEIIYGNWFLNVINYIYNALRLPVRPIVEAWKGSRAVEGLLRREGEHFLGGIGTWGMRDCRLLF
jgi:hypothetical protein